MMLASRRTPYTSTVAMSPSIRMIRAGTARHMIRDLLSPSHRSASEDPVPSMTDPAIISRERDPFSDRCLSLSETME